MKKLLFPAVIAVVVMLVGTLVQAIWTERFAPFDSEQLRNFTERIQTVPLKIGSWTGKNTEVSEEETEASGCTGYVSRVYENPDGETVSVYLVSGTRHKVALHTPEWCYPAAGYKTNSSPTAYVVDCGDKMKAPEFSTQAFSKEDELATQHLRIFWTFSDDGDWVGPRYPRVRYAGPGALYKIYLITTMESAGTPPEDSPSVKFCKELMPLLKEKLFPKEEQADKSPAEKSVAASG